MVDDDAALLDVRRLILIASNPVVKPVVWQLLHEITTNWL